MSLAQMDTWRSVQLKSSPTQPMSTASSSSTWGRVAPPWPTSSWTVKHTSVSYRGRCPAMCISLSRVSRQAALPLSSINRDLRKPLSVTTVLGSMHTKSPGAIPRASTPARSSTTSSMRTARFFSSRGRVSTSSKTWAAGDRDRMVPVYIRPSLVWMRQYSPSRVGRMGPPILVVISMPSAVMERTMRPRVSMWAHRPTRFPFSRPGTDTTRFPLLVRRTA